MYDVIIENDNRNFTQINGHRCINRITGAYTKEKNKVPSFTFIIYPDNEGYSRLFERKTIVRITDPENDKKKFSGRVLLIEKHMDSTGIYYKKVTCEGLLGIFNDTLNYFFTTNMNGQSQYYIVNQLVINHNSQVGEEQNIQLIDFQAAPFVENYKPTSERTTLEALYDEQLTYNLNYEILEEFDHQQISHKYLNCITEANIKESATKIVLGKNMTSVSVISNFDNLCTVCLPLTNENATMGIVGKDKITVEDSNAISKFGYIVKTHKFESITQPSALKGAAETWLSMNSNIKETITLNAIDLYGLGIDPEEFDIYKKFQVICTQLDINEILELTKITRDINDIWNTEITFGYIYYSARGK